MRLACLSVLGTVAACSLKTSRAEIPRAQSHRSDLQSDSSNEREAEGGDNIVIRRAVRKDVFAFRSMEGVEIRKASLLLMERKAYPEESEHRDIGHRQASIRVSPVECSCPVALARGTLVAVVSALAFLGFFSTSVLLVVAVCILRLVEKQKKKEKEEKPARSSHRRRAPPAPPPRPEHTYMTVRPLHGYERLHPASSHAAQGVYLSASDLNSGPRARREKSYQSASTMPVDLKSTPENEYIAPGPAPAFSTPLLENKYMNAHLSQPQSLTGSIQDTVMSPLLSPKGRENHIYEEVE